MVPGGRGCEAHDFLTRSPATCSRAHLVMGSVLTVCATCACLYVRSRRVGGWLLRTCRAAVLPGGLQPPPVTGEAGGCSWWTAVAGVAGGCSWWAAVTGRQVVTVGGQPLRVKLVVAFGGQPLRVRQVFTVTWHHLFRQDCLSSRLMGRDPVAVEAGGCGWAIGAGQR